MYAAEESQNVLITFAVVLLIVEPCSLMQLGNTCCSCTLLLDATFLEHLQYRFHRKVRPGILSDIYDAEVYGEHREFFQNQFNISFTFNFDGAPTFKSSTMQLWPVQLGVNELPPHLW